MQPTRRVCVHEQQVYARRRLFLKSRINGVGAMLAHKPTQISAPSPVPRRLPGAAPKAESPFREFDPVDPPAAAALMPVSVSPFVSLVVCCFQFLPHT